MSKKVLNQFLLDIDEYVIQIIHHKGKVLEISVLDEGGGLIESLEITNADEEE